MSYVWEIPGFKADDGVGKILGYATRGWQLSGTGSLQSGAPVTYMAYGVDMNGDGVTSNDRPFLGNPSAPLYTVGEDGVYLGGAKNGYTPGVLYSLGEANLGNPATVVTPNDVHFIIKPGNGNVARNTATDAGTVTWNTAVARNFRIPRTEGHTFQVRADFFNLLNHPNNDYGIIDNVLGDVTTPSGVGGGNGNTFMNPYYARNGYRRSVSKQSTRSKEFNNWSGLNA